MTTALVLGKFAPLHAGHQLLIETALYENTRTIVVIYDAPEHTTIPLPVRAGWLRALYPQIDVIQAWDGPQQVGDTDEIKIIQEQYLLRVLDKQSIDNFYSSEFYGAHISQALGARDRRIDPKRKQFPVSGTQIRAQPHKYRKFLSDIVYRDLIARVVFLGAPSTGKSTLAQNLAESFATTWMPEYGREYWFEHHQDRRLTPAQMVEIAQGHLDREQDLLLQARRYLFVDTEAITTLLFALDYHGKAEPRLTELADAAEKRYDLFFLCSDDIPFEDTFERSGALHRSRFQKIIVAELKARKLPFITLTGSLEKRMARVQKVLTDFDRFAALGDSLIASGRVSD